ncbi:MAG: DUF5615 family PIN-like protein [Halobacteria archaeon]|nr:DUF5615 family PIN-like protein [Halobacteria archaeon]
MARFLTDAMLGKLTRYLRMAGHDVVYVSDHSTEDGEVREKASETRRTVLTRDTDFESDDDAVVLESRDVEGQLRELHDEGVDLCLGTDGSHAHADGVRPRCSDCNGELTESETRPGHAPPEDEAEEVWRCVDCGKHYWKGSHWDDVRETFEDVRQDA